MVNWNNFLWVIMIMGIAFVVLGLIFFVTKDQNYFEAGVINFFIGVVLIFCSALVKKFRLGGASNVVPQIKYLESSERNY